MKTVDPPRVTNTLAQSGLETVEFSVEMDANAYRIIIDGLYTDKISTVLRELSTNAFDSHQDNGTPHVPFLVSFPTGMNPSLIIRDFGTGMTDDEIMHTYTKMFKSTKRDTNNQVGQLGIGSKSPFAIADAFMVKAYTGTHMNMYAVALTETGVPSLTRLTPEPVPSDETRGIAIEVTVPPSMYRELRDKARKVFRSFPVTPTFAGAEIQVDQPVFTAQDGSWSVYKHDRYEAYDRLTIRQGVVDYPYTSIDHTPLAEGYELVVNVPIGTADVAASREALSITPQTRERVEMHVEKAYNDLRDVMQYHVESAPTYTEAVRRYEPIKGVLRSFQPRFKGRKLDPNVSTKIEGLRWNAPGRAKDAKTMRGDLYVTRDLRETIQPERFVVVRSDAPTLPRRLLRLQEWAAGYNSFDAWAYINYRIIYDPTPQQLRRLVRAFPNTPPNELIISEQQLPDVEVQPKSKTEGVRGVYFRAQASWMNPTRVSKLDDIDLSKALYVITEKTGPRAEIEILPEEKPRRLQDLNSLFKWAEEHYGITTSTLLVTPHAAARLKLPPQNELKVKLSKYVEKITGKLELATYHKAVVNLSNFGYKVVDRVLGYSAPSVDTIPNWVHQTTAGAEIKTAATERAIEDVDKIYAKSYPLVFNQSKDEVVFEYMDALDAIRKQNTPQEEAA